MDAESPSASFQPVHSVADRDRGLADAAAEAEYVGRIRDRFFIRATIKFMRRHNENTRPNKSLFLKAFLTGEERKELDDSPLLQSLQVELLRVRQMAQHAGNPLLVYFIEMAIEQMKRNCLVGADGSTADAECENPMPSGFAQFE